MGSDPYSISDADASFVEAAGNLFVGEALVEFLAGIGKMHHAAARDTGLRETARTTALESLHRLERRPRYRARLPELHDAARQIHEVKNRRPGERSWAPGYRAARAFRGAIGVSGDDIIESPKVVAGRLGGRRFAPVQGLSDILAVVVRDDSDVRIHLRDRGRRQWSAWAENFAFARAVGDAVCYPEAGRSVVNNLHDADVRRRAEHSPPNSWRRWRRFSTWFTTAETSTKYRHRSTSRPGDCPSDREPGPDSTCLRPARTGRNQAGYPQGATITERSRTRVAGAAPSPA